MVLEIRPIVLLRLLEAASTYKHSWLEAVKADLDWTASVSEELSSWRGCSLQDWADHMAVDNKGTKASIARVCRMPTSNVCAAWAKTASHRSLDEVWICDYCGVQCRRKQVLAAHQWQKHGMKRLTRRYVDGTLCVACMLEFHDTDRLI